MQSVQQWSKTVSKLQQRVVIQYCRHLVQILATAGMVTNEEISFSLKVYCQNIWGFFLTSIVLVASVIIDDFCVALRDEVSGLICICFVFPDSQR